MKKLLFLVVFLCMTSSAFATSMTWTDTVSFGSGVLLSATAGKNAVTSKTYTQTITDSGFVVGKDTVNSIDLEIYYKDDQNNDGAEKATISLTGTSISFKFNLNNNSSGEINMNSNAYKNFLAEGIIELNEKGEIVITITATTGDFYLMSSVLTAKGEKNTTPTPEPASLFLVGMGLIGLAFTKKRFGKK